VAAYCEHVNEFSQLLKGEEVLRQLGTTGPKLLHGFG
jgi:hypothetical protein